MLLRELTQPTDPTLSVDEAKKRKRKARRTTGMSAAYGPGPYGGYGYYAGYSGDSGGGDGGGGGESIENENFVSGTAMMGKIADSGKIIRILKKAHTVPFSDEKNWLLVDMDPAKGNSGLGIKWIPADTRFTWVRPYRDTVDENFNEFKIIKEAAENIAVIGDSIAVGIKSAGGVSAGNAVGGSNTKQVLGFVTDFVQSGKAKGATVILSSGAANSANVSTVDGKKFQSENLGPVSAQIKQLKVAGAKVVLVGVASGKTPPQKPTQYTNGKQWIIDYTGMNDQLAAIASANGATFLGPLEEFDPGISKGDGIHPFNGYGKLFKAGSAGADTRFEWVRPYRDSIDENFADGRNPQDKGDAKRHGVNTKGSVSSLRKTAKQGGRKGQLAHWMANMKAGKKKSLNEAVIHPGIMDALEDFLPFVMKMLKLDKLPRIGIHKTIETGDQPSFGGYDMENNSIQLALKDRHPADILRTLAHELVHYKQNTTHELDDQSGSTGSPEENEANSKAGVIMRQFNKRFPQYLE